MTNTFSRIFLTIAIIACLYFFYAMFFSREFKSKNIVKQICETEVKTIEIDSFKDNTWSVYQSGNKYQITINHDFPQEFKSTGRYEVWIVDIYGNLVTSYDSKYDGITSHMWNSDYERLMKHIYKK